ncbi:MAG: hypothetical protein AB7N80_08535 [Bdellovibrionales bacterium]
MPTKSRLYLVDIIKVLFLSLIIWYDSYAILWEDLSHDIVWPTGHAVLWDWYYYTFRTLTYAGFAVLAIFSFLAGYKKGRVRLVNLIILVAFSCLFVSFSEGGFRLQSLWVEWDIYHYLLITLLCTYVCTKNPKWVWPLGTVGAVLYFVPWDLVADQLQLSVQTRRIWTGHCEYDGRGGWHLLPWIGLSWVMYAWGHLSANHAFKGRRELIAWLPVLAVCFYNWGAYADPPMSYKFYCYVFSRSSLDFWFQMLPVLFLLRLATAIEVQQFFERHPRFQWVSHTHLAKKLGIAFIVHIFVYYFFGFFTDVLLSSPWILNAYFLVLLPLVNTLTKATDWVIQKLKGNRP